MEVHLFAAARAAAGTSVLTVAPGTLASRLDELVRVAPALAPVLPRCSFLVDGMAVRSDGHGVTLEPGSRLDVLPPFAGG